MVWARTAARSSSTVMASLWPNASDMHTLNSLRRLHKRQLKHISDTH